METILCFGSRWLDLRHLPPLPNAGEQLISECDPTSHPFNIKCGQAPFQIASLSEPQPNPESLDDSHIIYILGYQATAGLSYFRITIYNPDYSHPGPRARMDVDLVGVYKICRPQAGIRWTFGLSLGPEGKRGIWIERSSNLKEFVVAASFDQSCSTRVPVESGDNLEELYGNAPRIESVSKVST